MKEMTDCENALKGRGFDRTKISKNDASSPLGDLFASKRKETERLGHTRVSNSGKCKRRDQIYADSDGIVTECDVGYSTQLKGKKELVPSNDTASPITKQKNRFIIYRTSFWAPRLLFYLVIMGSLPGIDPSVLSKTICKYMNYKDACEKSLSESLRIVNQSEEKHCIGEFDNYICWPHTAAGKMNEVPCPDFVTNFNDTKSAYRYCQPNGTWFKILNNKTGELTSWRHIGACTVEENSSDSLEPDSSQQTLLFNLRIMYSTGYALSLVCLVVALLLLSLFKKLHCTRNYIHMNLMVSFILRYVVVLIKDHVLIWHYSLDGVSGEGGSIDFDQMRQYCDDDNSTGWVLTRCRLVMTLMHYAITANYFWLLAEGLYLQMLLVFVMSENKYFSGFMVFGWGAPWISILVWVLLRMNYENEGCWDMNNNMHIWWTIRAPIMISIIINFCIFINIVRLIVSKLKAHNLARADIKLRLAKSTLALIPLLGIHYIIFLAITEEVIDPATTPMHLKLAFDMFFSSIQGTLISILYCFLNNEVRVEVKRAWNLWRSRKDLPKGGSALRKSSTINSANHSTQVTQVYSRHSANGMDIPFTDLSHHSSKSSNSDGECKDEPTIEATAMGNGNCITIDEKKARNFKIFNSIPADIKSALENGHDTNTTNGNIDCSPDVPFLRKDMD